MKMIKKRVAELNGEQLDWAVAIAQGWHTRPDGIGGTLNWYRGSRDDGYFEFCCDEYYPSELWEHGGPIIERENIWLAAPNEMRSDWSAAVGNSTEGFLGPTPLIAAMRAFVASKLGDEVEVPE